MQVSKTLRLGFKSLLARQFKDISNSMSDKAKEIKAEVKEQFESRRHERQGCKNRESA